MQELKDIIERSKRRTAWFFGYAIGYTLPTLLLTVAVWGLHRLAGISPRAGIEITAMAQLVIAVAVFVKWNRPQAWQFQKGFMFGVLLGVIGLGLSTAVQSLKDLGVF